jgi:membrane protein
VKTIKLSRRIILPGFEGLSLYVVTKVFFKGLLNGALNMRASSLAFSFFLALFPTVIFLFTLIPYIPIENFQDYLFNLMQSIMPKSAFAATEDIIAEIIKKQNGSLLSFGFISALLFSTNGFNAMINSFSETYHAIESRKPIMQRLVSLALVLVTVIMISAAISLILITEWSFGTVIHLGSFSYYLIVFGKWIILFGLCFSFISLSYYIGPKRKKGWQFFSAGSMFATVFTIIASLIFSYYINNFGNYNKLYGSIGTIIVVMLWIYINSLILLLGFDLNVSIHKAKYFPGALA